jgi:hypothetical protein
MRGKEGVNGARSTCMRRLDVDEKIALQALDALGEDKKPSTKIRNLQQGE